jgi:predicted DNA-binding transcriptional regulator YafY
MRADRLISIMLLLHARGRLTAQKLAQHLEVSERTIYRDVDALSAAGVPVYVQPGVNGGIFLDENYRISISGIWSRKKRPANFATIASGASNRPRSPMPPSPASRISTSPPIGKIPAITGTLSQGSP